MKFTRQMFVEIFHAKFNRNVLLGWEMEHVDGQTN